MYQNNVNEAKDQIRESHIRNDYYYLKNNRIRLFKYNEKLDDSVTFSPRGLRSWQLVSGFSTCRFLWLAFRPVARASIGDALCQRPSKTCSWNTRSLFFQFKLKKEQQHIFWERKYGAYGTSVYLLYKLENACCEVRRLSFLYSGYPWMKLHYSKGYWL